MAGLVRPKSYPIRRQTDDSHDNGIVYNPPRFARHGGLSSASKVEVGSGPFGVESPAGGRRSAEKSNRELSE